MALLEVLDLHAHFETRAGLVKAVDGVSFSVAEGESIALVGESGCGKSVTALSLMGLVASPPGKISGQAQLDSQDLLGIPEEQARSMRGRKIAMVFQDPMTSLNPVMKVGAQVSEALLAHVDLDSNEARARSIELMQMVGIPGAEARFDDYPHQFSGGMRQRLMIAMAISCNPRLLLADEVTTALDVTIQAQILELLRRLSRDRGMAVLMITHDLGIVAGMTHKVIVMYAGKIVEMSETGELFRDSRMPYTWGLLKSIPRLDQRGQRLIPIEGSPPDLLSPPAGCRFASRCPYAREICLDQDPELIAVPGALPGHLARCWGAQDVPDGGWLIEAKEHSPIHQVWGTAGVVKSGSS